jgi:hypothetical protein
MGNAACVSKQSTGNGKRLKPLGWISDSSSEYSSNGSSRGGSSESSSARSSITAAAYFKDLDSLNSIENLGAGKHLWGSSTEASFMEQKKVFNGFGEKCPPEFIAGIALYKMACVELKRPKIGREKADALHHVCRHMADGKFNEQFPLKFNKSMANGIEMLNTNANEVLKNAANTVMLKKARKKVNLEDDFEKIADGMFPELGRLVLHISTGLACARHLLPTMKALDKAVQEKRKSLKKEGKSTAAVLKEYQPIIQKTCLDVDRVYRDFLRLNTDIHIDELTKARDVCFTKTMYNVTRVPFRTNNRTPASKASSFTELVTMEKEVAETLIKFVFKLLQALQDDEEQLSGPSQMEAKVDRIAQMLEEVMSQAQETQQMFKNEMDVVVLTPETFVLLDNIQLLNREIVNLTNFLYGIRVEVTDQKLGI